MASPAPEDLAAYEAALRAAYEKLDEAKTDVDLALDDVQSARDEARGMYGTPEASSIFGKAIADIHLAGRVIADAIDALPPLDEGMADKGGGASEVNS